jgi:gliding motility-associated-like protein/uncharacterized repeat protein (TIGR01451 family)
VAITNDTLVEPTETYGVTLSNITGGLVTIADATAIGTITDKDVSSVSIAATTHASEPGTDGLFTLTLSNLVNVATTVNYTITGTATAGTDYTALTGSITIPANTTTITIPVGVIDDSLVETGGETVVVTLTSTDTAVTIGTPAAATVTIADEELSVPSLILVKTATLSGTGAIGSIITFTFTITNTGNVPLNNIVIDDALLSATPIVVPGILGLNAVVTKTATYVITQADVDAGNVINTATASGFDPNGNRVSDVSDNGNPNDGNDNPTIILLSQSPSIAIITTAVFDDNNGDGFAQAGETVTYSFTITNIGNVTLTNISIPNNLLGIVVTGGPISLGVGQSDSTTFTGTYILTQADIILGTVTNQATVVGTSPSGVVVQDKSDDLDNSKDNPTVLSITGCVIEVFNAVSPNGDGDNDVFYIRGLECYPDNSVEVFNRWGVLVFERDHYNNADRAFRGVSEGRVTVNQAEELPEGTYYYVFKYKDGNANGHQKAGYLYINRK